MSLTIKQGRRKEPRRIQGCDREDARIRVRSLFRSRTQIGNIISRPWDHQTLVMKLPSNIPILHATNGELLAGSPRSAVVLSSARSNWHVKYVQHVVCVNEGRVVTFETKKDGRRHRVLERGAVSLFPSHCPFFSRRKKGENGSAHVLLVALDPVFVKQTVASLEVYPVRVELIHPGWASLSPRQVDRPADVGLPRRARTNGDGVSHASHRRRIQSTGSGSYCFSAGPACCKTSLSSLFKSLVLRAGFQRGRH
jgi:hypothetical protein